jgi:hypothetical protein
MSEEKNEVALPATPFTYRFVSVHRVFGSSALPGGTDLEVPTGTPSARVILTIDPAAALAETDRNAARQMLALRQIFHREENSPAVDQEAARIAQERLNKFGTGVYMIVEVSGAGDTIPTAKTSTIPGAWVAFDAVDRKSIIRQHRPLVNWAVAAVALMASQTPDVTRVSEAVELMLPGGVPLQSLTFSGGEARLYVGRPLTNEDGHAISRRIGVFAARPKLATPCRLLSDALRSTENRLEAFLFAWGALETLVNPYAASIECEAGKWVDIVAADFRESATVIHKGHVDGGHAHYSLAKRVAVFGLMHGVDPANWVATFHQIKTSYREPLAHLGNIPPSGAADVTIELVRGLLRAAVDAP